MIFSAPIFLVGLAALLVPIVIHLWSKNTRTFVGFGSLRFLRETETRTMRSIMPNQWLLLLLRLLLLTLLVFVLARPLLDQEPKRVQTLYLIDTRYADTPFLTQLKDTLSDQHEVRWLAMGFPAIDANTPKVTTDHWTLLAQKPAVAADRTVVVSPLLVKDFFGEKRAFPVRYEWFSLSADPVEERSFSYTKNNQKLAVKTRYDEWRTSHALEPIATADPLKITYAIHVDESYALYEEVFEAAITSLNALSPLSIERVADQADWLLWFSDKEAPQSRKLMRVSLDEIQPWWQVTDTHIRLSPKWTKETAIAEQLPHRLLSVFAGGLYDDSSASALRMDVNTFDYAAGTEQRLATTQQDASAYLWLVLLAVLLAERWLAAKSDRK